MTFYFQRFRRAKSVQINLTQIILKHSAKFTALVILIKSYMRHAALNAARTCITNQFVTEKLLLEKRRKTINLKFHGILNNSLL